MTRLPRLAACALTFLTVLAGASPASAALTADRAAGAPTRWQYTPTPTDPPEGSLSDVSCVSSRFCLAVGTIYVATTTSGVEAPLAEVRGRSGWHHVATTGLPRTITSLGRVSCGRARRCLAFTDGRHVKPVWWTGRRWRVVPLPRPAQDHPVDLDCAGGASCMVVGERGHLAWSWHWNGRHWTSVPSTRAKLTYRDVSCPRLRLCRAVGVRVARDGSRHAVVSLWSGRRWSLHDLPGGWHGALSAIDCSTATSCTAVGHVGGYDRGRVLAETLIGHTWHASRTRLPQGGHPISISCRSAIRCTAVVVWCCLRSGYHRFSLVGRGTDGVWRTGRGKGSVEPVLRAVACSRAACSTVGAGPLRPLAFRGPGLRPRREAVTAPPSPSPGTILDVSCTPSGFCAAVDDGAVQPLVHPAGGRWRRTGRAGIGDQYSVSCSSPRFCMAMFRRALLWDGHRWRQAKLPARVVLRTFAVDCLSPTWCDAVGNGHLTHAVIEHWDGVRWRVVIRPRRKLPGLDAIDCVSTTDCLAMGDGDVLRWDGTRWRVLDTTGVPSGADVVDLSCWDTNRCLAVYSSGRVARFDGTRFTTTTVGPGVRPRMAAVACRAADACVAVGRAGSPGHRHGVVRSWDGTRWRAVPGPSVPLTYFYSVSCSAQQCWAGGWLYRNPRAAEYPLLARIR